LRPIKSNVDEDLSSWYKKHSLIYVASDHACWTDKESAKRVLKKRFGAIQRSPESGLKRMMSYHALHSPTVFDWIMERVTPDESGNTTEDEKMV
jgi:histone deacetylase 6